MAKATWNGVVLAECDSIETVEGNAYFPPSSINKSHFSTNSHSTVCGWKGTANYYDITVDGETKRNAAWYYADPKNAAENIRGYVAFYPFVTIEK